MTFKNTSEKLSTLNTKITSIIDNVKTEFNKDNISIENYNGIQSGIIKLRDKYSSVISEKNKELSNSYKKGDNVSLQNIDIKYEHEYLGSTIKSYGASNNIIVGRKGFCKVISENRKIIVKGYSYDSVLLWSNTLSEKIDCNSFTNPYATQWGDYDITLVKETSSYGDYVFHRVCLDGTTGEIIDKLLSAHSRSCNRNRDCSAYPKKTACTISRYLKYDDYKGTFCFHDQSWKPVGTFHNILELDTDNFYFLTSEGFFKSSTSNFNPTKYEFPKEYTIKKGVDIRFPDTSKTGSSQERCQRDSSLSGYVTITENFVYIYNSSKTLYKYTKDGKLYSKIDIDNFTSGKIAYINDDYILNGNGIIYNQNGYEMKNISYGVSINFIDTYSATYKDSFLLNDNYIMLLYTGNGTRSKDWSDTIISYNIFDINKKDFIYRKAKPIIHDHNPIFVSKNIINCNSTLYELIQKPSSILIK